MSELSGGTVTNVEVPADKFVVIQHWSPNQRTHATRVFLVMKERL